MGTKLLSFAHPRGVGNSDQQSFRADETTDSLTARLLLVLDQHPMTLGFEFSRCLFHVINIKLKPSLWNGNVIRPRFGAETGLRRLRKRPHGKMFCAVQKLSMKVSAILLFEADPKTLTVELSTCRLVPNDSDKSARSRSSLHAGFSGLSNSSL
jgi:hypothetical protein